MVHETTKKSCTHSDTGILGYQFPTVNHYNGDKMQCCKNDTLGIYDS